MRIGGGIARLAVIGLIGGSLAYTPGAARLVEADASSDTATTDHTPLETGFGEQVLLAGAVLQTGAQQTSGPQGSGVTIRKEVSLPVGDNDLVCGDGYVIDFDPNVAGDYRPGDRVCWRLTVEFPTDANTLNPIVTDVLPAGFTFESQQSGSDDTTYGNSLFSTADGRLAWHIDDNDNSGDRFQVVIQSVIDDPASISNGDSATNSMRFSALNPAGEVFELSDSAVATYIEQRLSIAKTPDATTSEAGDELWYTLDVSNTGGLAASEVSIRDVLPGGVECESIIDSGGATCSDANPDHLQWDGQTVQANSTLKLNYSLTVPEPSGTNSTLRNCAGVRQYQNPDNNSDVGPRGDGDPGIFVFRPADNIDPALTQTNTDAVQACANVEVTSTGGDPAPTIAKSADRATATIGETVRYTVDITVPSGVGGFDALVIDTLPASMEYLANVTSTCAQGGTPCDLTVAELTESGAIGEVGFFIGDFAPSTETRVLTVSYDADPVLSANGDTLTNSAVLLFNDSDKILGTPEQGDPLPDPATFDNQVGPATTDVTVIGPRLVIDKRVGGQVDDTDTRNAVPGETLDFTLAITNQGKAPAYEIDVLDTPDPRLTDFTDTTDSDRVINDAGDPAAGFLKWSVPGPLDPGETITISYSLTVPDTLDAGDEVPGFELTNSADIGVYTNVSEADQAGRTFRVYDDVDPDVVEIELDFGGVEPVLASIGDRVWSDTNRNGVQDDGEPGLNGVDVLVTWHGPDGVFGDADDQSFPVTTGVGTAADPARPNGVYLVENLQGGQYTVAVDTTTLPSGVTATYDLDDGIASPDNSWTGALGAAEDKRDVDFGYVGDFPAGDNTLGDTVWWDVDRDGEDDGADLEPRLSNVAVTVTWFGPDRQRGGGDDVVIPVDATDANGNYLATNLPDGRYEIRIDESTIPAGFANTVDPQGTSDSGNPGAANSVSTVQVGTNDGGDPIGNSNLDQDFGYAGTGTPGDASLGDLVWLDLDGDGIGDDGEPGLFGVAITVVNNDTNETFNVSTNEQGVWTVPGLPAGGYTVTLDETTLPAGIAQTFGLQGGTNDPQPSVIVVLPAGTTRTDVDFGYSGVGRIGDTVYLDNDGDGTQNTAPGDEEPGIAGQTVVLTWDGVDGTLGTPDDTAFTTTTDENGEYLFTGLPDGDYAVTVGTPAAPGITAIAMNTGDPDGNAPNTSEVTLDDANGRENLDQDFGFLGENSIGDTVWLDANANGTDDGADSEDRLPGVDVVVTWFGLDGIEGTSDDADLPTVTTDDDGIYGVGGLPDGTYRVTVVASTVPAGLNNTVDTGDAPGAPLDGSSVETLGDTPGSAPENDREQDFGYVGGGSISGTILLDSNGDGDQNANEIGLAGIRIVLTLPGGGTRVTFTDEHGDYSFPGLPAGDYTVDVDETTLPAGVEITFDDDDGTMNPDGTMPVTLGENENREDVDAGYVGLGSIGDTVYLDHDGNGTQNVTPGAEEPGLPGQTVVLTGAGQDGAFGTPDDVVATATTDDAGMYLFTGLPDGDYTVTVGTPAAPGITAIAENTGDPDGNAPNTSEVTLDDANGRTNLDQDFGYQGENSVGDTVWLDANADGIDDGAATEDRLPGVDVVVTWFGLDGIEGPVSGPTGTIDDDVTFPAEATDDDGIYVVSGLPDGTYAVDVDETTLPNGLTNTVDSGDVAAGNTSAPIDGRSVVVLGDDAGSPPENDRDQDFGYVGGASISGTIVLDANGDGVQTPGEGGIPGVRIVLTLPDNTTREVFTDENGGYTFPGLQAGDYTVDVDETTLPDGVAITFDNDNGTTAPDGTMPVTLGANENREDVDAGYTGQGTIGDTVYFDLNSNGTQDEGEPAIPGQLVRLRGEGADGVLNTADDLIIDDVTDENGTYLFDGLPDGDYIVTVGTPADPGITAVADNTGDPDGGISNQSEVTLGAAGRIDLDQDFGYVGDNSVGDTLFLDANADGVDGDDAAEPGIAGVDVIVTWFGVDGIEGPSGGVNDDVDFPAATTNDQGVYGVSGLPDGTFRVDVDDSTLPADYDPTVDSGDAGTSGAGTAPDGRSTVSLAGGEENLDQDFGYVNGSSISGTIVLDKNSNGVQDGDETGIAGVRVVLTGPDGLTRETVTDENGDYTFVGLPGGDYVVDVDETTLPDGVTITFDNDNGTVDPDGTMPVDGLGDNEDRTDVDAGYVGQGSVSGTVYLDLDGDGIQDPDEPGVPGQSVTLMGAGNDGISGTPDDLLVTVVTDVNGAYDFNGLPDGDYMVTIPGGVAGVATNTGDPDGGDPDKANITLGDGGRDITDQDFGYQGLNALGDTVFLDANLDGVDGDDTTEPGIDGVAIIVTWFGPDGVAGTADDIVLPTATTSGGGIYSVDGLPDGTFSVVVDQATLPAGFDPTVDSGDAPGAPLDGSSEVTLQSVAGVGETNDGQDFGVAAGGPISGTVIFDLNGNDAQDGNEPGLAGIRVVLTGPNGLVRDTVTDENGNYTFPGLPAGQYVVDIDETTLPDGVTATFDTDGGDDGITSLTLGTNPDGTVEDRIDVDFGYQGVGTIGGTTYLDLNGDGVQGPTEPGVPGQPVVIKWAGPDGVFATPDDVDFPTVTTADGSYQVPNLPDGNFMVVIGPSGLPTLATNSGDPDGGVPDKSNVTLGPDDRVKLDEDFGYVGDNGIGDTVYIDANGNGVDDGATVDPRVVGAGVAIVWAGVDGVPGTADDVVLAAITNQNGVYGGLGLPDGTFSVTLDPATLPGGVLPSVDPDGGAPDGASVVVLSNGTVNLDQDFGLAGGASIGDTVWLDLDGDGIRDLGEPGIEGATVTATYLGPDGQPGGGDDEVFTTTVDAAGNYFFLNVPAGVYDIVVSGLPAGVTSSADPDGGADGRSRITIGLDESNFDQDFGFVGSASVGDTIFWDTDGDGTKDPIEPGISGITVTITSAGSDGVLGTDDDIVVTTTTNADGMYLVTGLPSGPTSVTYNPADVTPGLNPLGDLDGGDATSTVVTLVAGQTNPNVDFAVGGDAGMSGTLFNDINGNGVQDPGEAGVPGVTVVVIWNGPNGTEEVRVVTDSNGDWSLDNLPAGTYTVGVDLSTLPPGVNVPAGLPISVVLSAGGSQAVDIPVVNGGDIFGGVFNDIDGDGIRDPGETGTPSVTVVLIDSNGSPVATTVTDNDGNYVFTNIAPGTYTIVVDPATLPTGTRIISETDGIVDGRTAVTVVANGAAIGGGFGVGTTRRLEIPRTGNTGTELILRIAFTALLAGLLLLMVRRRRSEGSGMPDAV